MILKWISLGVILGSALTIVAFRLIELGTTTTRIASPSNAITISQQLDVSDSNRPLPVARVSEAATDYTDQKDASPRHWRGHGATGSW
jgi:hypothetical protein